MLDQIKQRDDREPIILVGHGMGGDTAVDIARELNTEEHGFRNVHLLVTIDSVGFKNDLIPDNVRTNLNYIGDQDSLLNDAPNMPVDPYLTEVINHLRTGEDHEDMDDSEEIQTEVKERINEILNTKKMANINPRVI